MARFQAVEVKQAPRIENYRADILARMAATSYEKIPRLVLVETKICPSILYEVEVMCLEAKASLLDPIITYIWNRTLPANKRQAAHLNGAINAFN